ncbi:general stress protein [Bacillus sp. FJAT-49732]|uniref:General stress protein n=1 Tax=Lederbergia citrisecunda TaxID=2833583 RepID=A0A942TLV9_9BACI|nr:general stress protein [Lederbergia citrisecunda]MBS4199077.1 general stress protein [Lederbergia citrisecunda]
MGSQIVGIFDSQQEVINEIKNYEAKGMERSKFSVLAKDESKTDYLTEKMDVDEQEPANEGAFGLLGGFLAGIGGGIAVPGMAIPGIGPLMAAGPIASAFVGNNEDLRNMFISMGNEELADRYMEELDAGKIILFLDE